MNLFVHTWVILHSPVLQCVSDSLSQTFTLPIYVGHDYLFAFSVTPSKCVNESACKRGQNHRQARTTHKVLQGIRLIKAYGWEAFYAEAIGKFRKAEIKTMKKASCVVSSGSSTHCHVYRHPSYRNYSELLLANREWDHRLRTRLPVMISISRSYLPRCSCSTYVLRFHAFFPIPNFVFNYRTSVCHSSYSQSSCPALLMPLSRLVA